MKAIILAAGMGRRLGHEMPKCLTPLVDGMTILNLQLTHLRCFTDDIRLVVGYRHDEIQACCPECCFTYNEHYASTNTAASLTLGLEATEPVEDILWINGDVVCSRHVLARVLAGPGSAMATKRGQVADEEVKYTTDETGRILAVSKQLSYAKGEAVGVNLIRHQDRDLLLSGLKKCVAQDYFEKGIEFAIADGLQIYEVDVSDQPCIEIDFPTDLEAAKKLLPRCLPAPRPATI